MKVVPYIPSEPFIRDLNGDGDFRSPECIEIIETGGYRRNQSTILPFPGICRPIDGVFRKNSLYWGARMRSLTRRFSP